MIFGSYIAGAGTGDTEKRKLQSVRHFFNNPGKTLCQLIIYTSTEYLIIIFIDSYIHLLIAWTSTSPSFVTDGDARVAVG